MVHYLIKIKTMIKIIIYIILGIAALMYVSSVVEMSPDVVIGIIVLIFFAITGGDLGGSSNGS